MQKGPTLVVLAAGMGSRYGGLKQIDAFGPGGETILEYSVYDAIREGFGSVVFIIRRSFEDAFKAAYADKLKGIDVSYVYQELDDLPEGITCHQDRSKPWGTGHAVWVAHRVVGGPFAVINADDFYGRDAYRQLYNYFMGNESPREHNYVLVGYELIRTLSDYGTVNRGVCAIDEHGDLAGIEECLKIGRSPDGVISYKDANEMDVILAPETIVSMNMWGFYPDYFDHFEDSFARFFKDHGNEPKSEYYIPNLVDELISSGQKKVRVLTCKENWFGVTYKEDKPMVIDRINRLVSEGVYPERLWER
jgi:dTDP-glucose pyrophosphorylase